MPASMRCAVIEGLSVLPGRKSVVFFAEGLALPDAVLPQFDSVVVTANRANVSVYTVDAAGLRVHSKDAETGREVRAAGAQSMIVNPDGVDGRVAGCPGATRRRPPQGSAHEPDAAGRSHGRLPDREHQRPRARFSDDRRRSPLPLPAHLHADEPGLYRRVAPRRGARAVAQGRDPQPVRLSRRAPAVGDPAARLRRPGAGGARSDAAAGRRAAAARRVRVSRGERRVAHRADDGRQRPDADFRDDRRAVPHGLHAARAHQGRQRRRRPESQPAVSAHGEGRRPRARAAWRDPLLPPARVAARQLRRRRRRARRAGAARRCCPLAVRGAPRRRAPRRQPGDRRRAPSD